jgi:hypothetical protein
MKSVLFFLKKFFLIVLVILVIFILFIATLWLPVFNSKNPVEFGVTFSKPYAEFLGLDWKRAYLAVLDDLGARKLRLLSEWDQIETVRDNYNFEDLDWQLREAEKRNAEVILVIGWRQPRWPECHTPKWLSDASTQEIQNELLEMLRIVINRYKDRKSIVMWQIENEPFLNSFGQCPRADKNFLQTEIALVKSLDNRPILITDSGELSTWRKTAHLGDYFGTTLFRIVYNKYTGYFHYFLPPSFYKLKAKLVGLSLDKVILIELQTEPWIASGSVIETSIEEQKKLMDDKRLQNYVDFSSRTGFREVYFWGVEWWYWLKEQGDESVWQVGKEIWRQ